jgi:hypothetical protein
VLVNAGVVIDLVATLLEAKDKLTFAQEAFEDKNGLMPFIMPMWVCKRSQSFIAFNQRQITKLE